jgi:AraC-like DNA-binding protein
MPPVRYLANWRLAVVASMLRTGTARLGRIAEEVGYESETAFNRAFKREHGVSPNRWRNRADTAGPAMD